MPTPAKLRLVGIQEACDRLGCGRRTFWTRWHAVFTETRPKTDRRHGVQRKVYEDELDAAVANAAKAAAAVANVRRDKKRV